MPSPSCASLAPGKSLSRWEDARRGPAAEGRAGDVVGPAGQGIAATEFEELVRAIQSGVTYVDVHSSRFPGGEIRGEIRGY